MGKKLWGYIPPSSRCFCCCMKHPNNNNKTCPLPSSLASSNTFMTDSRYLGATEIYWNLTEHGYYYLISTTSVIWPIDANCSPFQSLNMLPFHIRFRTLKVNLLSLISIFSKYYFKSGTICILFLFSHVFTALEFDINHFGIILWKIAKPCDHKKIKPPIKKIIKKYKQIRHYFVISQK